MNIQAMKLRRAARLTAVALASALATYLIVSNIAFYGVPAPSRPCRVDARDATAVRVGDFELYTRRIGEATDSAPIIALHGGPGHSSASFKRSLDGLADARQVVYYDQRGSGYSEVQPDATQYTVEQLVDELDILREEALGVDRMVLVAHSAGGALAQRYTLAHPEHVERVVLVGSIAINNGVAVPALWDALYPALFVLGAGFPPAEPEAADVWLTDLVVETSLVRLYDPDRRDLLSDSGPLCFATWRAVSRSLEGRAYRDELAKLDIPFLVIYGAADAGATGENVATDICETLPDCRLLRFEASGHWPFLEEPARFEREVRAFLAAP